MVDVMAILEKLDTYLSECARLPLVGRLMVDEDEVFNLIDDLRAALPQEIEHAKWLLKERERILAEARREADEILRDAQGQIASLASESAIAKEARIQAEELMQKSREVAREINLGAREYADDLMRRVEEVLVEATESIRQGRKELLTEKDTQRQVTESAPPVEETQRQAAATASAGGEYDDWASEEPVPTRKRRRA